MACQETCHGGSCSNTSSIHKDHVHDSQSASWEKTAMRVLEVVLFLGLSAYACYLSLNSLDYFLPFVGGGFLIGFVMQYRKLQNNETAFQNKECGGNCDQSTMSRLTRLSLPEPFGLLGAVAMTFDHMSHHKKVSVPIVGAFMGMFFGALAATAVHSLLNAKKAQVRHAV